MTEQQLDAYVEHIAWVADHDTFGTNRPASSVDLDLENLNAEVLS